MWGAANPPSPEQTPAASPSRVRPEDGEEQRRLGALGAAALAGRRRRLVRATTAPARSVGAATAAGKGKLESVGSAHCSEGGDSGGRSCASSPEAPGNGKRWRSCSDPRATSVKRSCGGRMDDYIASLHDASVALFGQGLTDAQGPRSGALPPHPSLQSQQSNSGMSASSGSGTVTATRQTNFSVYEDNVACKSWLEISCDPITNTGQKRESFWVRVCNRYNAQHGTYPERSQKSINTHWDHIKGDVSKFSGYMADKIRSNPSGMTDSDKSVAAAADFASIEKRSFSLMHCWHILKDEPKWMELKRSMDKAKNNAARGVTPQDSNSNTVDLDPDDPSPGSSTGKRPMGRDAAKVAKKKSSSVSCEYASKMHELSVQKISLFKERE